MRYKDLIKNWHAKASEEDYFAKFVFEYLAFIAHLRTQRYPGLDRERKAIQKFKKDQNVKRKYLSVINNNQQLRKDWLHIKGELDKAPLGNASRYLDWVIEIDWWNCAHDELNQRTRDEKKKPTGVLNSTDDWANMIEFWYSIRNNLFHGAKDPENKHDQFAVKYGYRTLKALMDILINENP